MILKREPVIYRNYYLAAFLVLGLIFGCAKSEPLLKSDEPEVQLNFVYISSEIHDWPDSDLKKAFSSYWFKRFAGEPSKDIFRLEAPHFQVMAIYERYQAYLKKFPRAQILRMEIASFVQATEHLYEIPVNIVFQDTDGLEQTMSTRDRWVYVEGKWYHVLRDPLVFPRIG
jgi:hypothetical protein